MFQRDRDTITSGAGTGAGGGEGLPDELIAAQLADLAESEGHYLTLFDQEKRVPCACRRATAINAAAALRHCMPPPTAP